MNCFQPVINRKMSFTQISTGLGQLFIVTAAFLYCEAVPTGYGGGYGSMLSGGLSSHVSTPIGLGSNGLSWGGWSGYGSGLTGLGLSSPVGLAAPLSSLNVAPAAPLLAAPYAQPQLLEVVGDDQPVNVIFRSLGARVHVQQVHQPSGPPQVEHTRSEDEPHRVVHEVIRPVIQEVREIIQPYRRLTQEIRPVLEEVKTVVAKGEKGLGAPALAGGYGLQGDLSGGGYGMGHGYKS